MKPTKLQIAEHSFVTYSHTPEIGMTIEDVSKAEYWAHVAATLRAGDRIDVMAGDGDWHSLLIVRAANRIEAVVAPLTFTKLGSTEDLIGDDVPYDVKWRGPARKFGIVRKSDGEVLKDEFQVREAAVKYLQGHMQALAR